MNSTTDERPASRRRSIVTSVLFLLVLGLWYGGISWWADAGIRRFEQHTFIAPTQPEAPQDWRERRFFADPDAYYWLAYARDLRDSSDWRIRYTYADNAPYGREVHWAQALIWTAAGLSFLFETLFGMPDWQALEIAGRVMSPLYGWFAFAAIFLLLRHRFGATIATITTALMVILLHWDFHTLRPDHHGLHLAFAMGLWLSLLFGGMGWVSAPLPNRTRQSVPSYPVARRWFMAAGLLGGIGAWLGATVFLFSLGAVVLGALCLIGYVQLPPKKEGIEPAPNVWRLWGVTGAATLLFFYLVEYVPNHAGMRLEVNHPLYALCWLGVAEFLRTLCLWRTQHNRLTGKQVAAGLCALAAAAMLPLLIVFGPSDWFLPRTEIMLRLHARHISEFKTLFETQGAAWFWTFIKTFGATIVSFVVAVVLFSRRRISFYHQITIMTLCVVTICFTGLYVFQVRWEPFALGAALLLTAAVLAVLSVNGQKSWARLLLVALLLHGVFGMAQFIVPLRALYRVEKIDPLWLNAMLQRNLMMQIREHLPHEVSLRFMISPEMAPATYYFGAGDSIGSLYWENVMGLEDAAAFFGSAPTIPGAKEVAQTRAVTHALIASGPTEASLYYDLYTGNLSETGAAQSIGGALAQSGAPIPPWLTLNESLNASVNPIYYTFVPKVGQYVPLHLNAVFYTLDIPR